MSAYYNENDPFAAAWLRELIKDKLIADGEVDERSIQDVKPEDVKDFKQAHFFAGIGVWSYALRLAGWEDERPVWTGSCTCPSFSCAGKATGFNDPRHLWPTWFGLVRECRPATIFGEQADDAIGFGWLDLVQSDLESASYAVGKAVFGACAVGAPHIRQRLYFVAESDGGESGDGDLQRSGKQRLVSQDGYSRESVADATDTRRAEARQYGSGRPLLSARPEQRERTRELADAERDERRTGESRAQEGIGSESDGKRLGGDGTDCRLDESQSDRLQGQEFEELSSDQARLDESTRRSGSAFELVDSEHDGRTARLAWDQQESEAPIGERTRSAGRSFWSDARWHFCRDGKYRPVPLESALFPLAPRTTGRVGLLRGAGNALCAPQAQAFVEAYLDLRFSKS